MSDQRSSVRTCVSGARPRIASSMALAARECPEPRFEVSSSTRGVAAPEMRGLVVGRADTVLASATTPDASLQTSQEFYSCRRKMHAACGWRARVGIIYRVESSDLEFSPAQMQAMGDAVLRRVIEHLAAIGEQPIRGDVDIAGLCRAMREPAPEQPTGLAPLLDALFEEWIPRSFNTAGPGYLAFIPGGGVFPATLADLISNGVNRYTGVWQAAPALVQLESNALDWLRDWMQFPVSTRGLFTTGGSTANLTA